MASDPTLTQRAVDKRIGKAQSWVSELLTWRAGDRRDDTPVARTDDDRRRRYVERQVPTRHEDRVEKADGPPTG
jgi:hypothetical protein